MGTLREVAQRAGVSIATASRVANGFDGVRPETRARVEEAMRRVLYVPSRRVRDRAIGLLVPELTNPIFPALAQAMEARATGFGLATILCNTAGSARREADYVHMLLERRVDGMIFISCEATDIRGDHGHYARLLEEGAHMVFVNGAVTGLNVTSVGVDEIAAGELATTHLIYLGHERIGFVAGPEHAVPTRDKEIGRELTLRRAGLDGYELIAHGGWGIEGGRLAMEKLLSFGSLRPTAVICSSDLMALGVLKAARAAGLSVPRDLSVVGFDGVMADWTEPPLTTLEQPIDEIAEAAVGTVAELMEDPGRVRPQMMFRPRLREGGSTAPPRRAQ